MDYSLPGSSVHRILQAGILEWVAMLSSRRSSQPRDQTFISFRLPLKESNFIPVKKKLDDDYCYLILEGMIIVKKVRFEIKFNDFLFSISYCF